jgi:hypothetical protein
MIKSGEGNSDAGVCVLGFLLAGAVAHNFGLAASPLSGVPYNGKLAVIAGFVVITAIAVFSTSKVKRAG